MIKIRAYDKYNKQWIYIILGDEGYDEMGNWTEEFTSHNGVFHKQIIQFQAIEGDKNNCNPKRWSDFDLIEII